MAVLSHGGIVEARQVEQTRANAVRYVAAARELLGRIAPPEHWHTVNYELMGSPGGHRGTEAQRNRLAKDPN